MTNKLWTYLGPKCDDQHWPTNIQGDDPAFNSNAGPATVWAAGNTYAKLDLVTNVIGGDTTYFIAVMDPDHQSAADNEPGVAKGWAKFWTYWRVPPGGKLSPPASATNNQLGVMIGRSRELYDARMEVRVQDALAVGGGSEDTPCREVEIVDHNIWRWQWQNESWLRCFPRNLIHITPTRDTAIGDFDIGDLVLVEATAEVKGGFSGVQRIYSYTISWDSSESVPAISELQTSSDGEGFQ